MFISYWSKNWTVFKKFHVNSLRFEINTQLNTKMTIDTFIFILLSFIIFLIVVSITMISGN